MDASGKDDMAIGELDTPVGRIRVAVSEIGLASISWVEDSSHTVSVADDDVRLEPVLAQLMEYFQGRRRDFDLPLDWRHTGGTAKVVLNTLHNAVHYGHSVTYGELATSSGTGIPARGIGAIMGSNRIPIVVPCHRVLAHDGLGGYSGGTARNGPEVKRWLLTLEGVLPPTLDWSPQGLDR